MLKSTSKNLPQDSGRNKMRRLNKCLKPPTYHLDLYCDLGDGPVGKSSLGKVHRVIELPKKCEKLWKTYFLGAALSEYSCENLPPPPQKKKTQQETVPKYLMNERTPPHPLNKHPQHQPDLRHHS